MSHSSELAAQNLRIAARLHASGVEIYRARMRRENPSFTADEVEQLVRAWLQAQSADPGGRRITDHPLLDSSVSSST